MYDYVEVRAGILRQNSFTPHEQTIRVANVSIHSDFDHQSNFLVKFIAVNIRNNNFPFTAYLNDIALLQLEEPLRFNRWVQPICLPIQDSDSPLNWTKKYENITCLAVSPFRLCISHVNFALTRRSAGAIIRFEDHQLTM